MIQTLRIILVGLMLSLLSQTTFAQYAIATQAVADREWKSPVGDGQGMINVGKTLMITGASLAMTGLTIGTFGMLTYEADEYSMNLAPVNAILGGVTGAAFAVVGLPIYCAGSNKRTAHGASLMSFTNEGQRGGVAAVEVSGGLVNHFSVDVIGGYNFNKHLFLGAGMGRGVRIMPNMKVRDTEDYIVPVYVNARLTGGSKRVVPYMSGRFGYDLNQSKVYYSLEYGTRFRGAEGERGASWWLGTKTEYLNDELFSIVLTAGKSF